MSAEMFYFLDHFVKGQQKIPTLSKIILNMINRSNLQLLVVDKHLTTFKSLRNLTVTK